MQGTKTMAARFVAGHKLPVRQPSVFGVSLWEIKLATSQMGKTIQEYRTASCSCQIYQATRAQNASASIRPQVRTARVVIAPLIDKTFLVWMTEIEKLQDAFKQLIDFFLADLVRSEELLEVEVWESAIGYPRGQQRAQAAGINRAQLANFLENRALQRIIKDSGIEQLANLNACPALDQNRAEKTQRVFLKLKCGLRIVKRHARFSPQHTK